LFQTIPRDKSRPARRSRAGGIGRGFRPKFFGNFILGRVDLLFKPEEGTDKVEKAQEVSVQFFKTRKYMSVLL